MYLIHHKTITMIFQWETSFAFRYHLYVCMIMISYFCIPLLLHLYSKPKCDLCKLWYLLGGEQYKKQQVVMLGAGAGVPPTASTKQWCQESGRSGSSCHNSAGVPALPCYCSAVWRTAWSVTVLHYVCTLHRQMESASLLRHGSGSGHLPFNLPFSFRFIRYET